jgi:DNA-binding NarL/FixJ family response regulator
MDGIEATCHFYAEMPGIKILALSIYSNDGFNSGMMRACALGYIVKGGVANLQIVEIRYVRICR